MVKFFFVFFCIDMIFAYMERVSMSSDTEHGPGPWFNVSFLNRSIRSSMLSSCCTIIFTPHIVRGAHRTKPVLLGAGLGAELGAEADASFMKKLYFTWSSFNVCIAAGVGWSLVDWPSHSESMTPDSILRMAS